MFVGKGSLLWRVKRGAQFHKCVQERQTTVCAENLWRRQPLPFILQKEFYLTDFQLSRTAHMNGYINCFVTWSPSLFKESGLGSLGEEVSMGSIFKPPPGPPGSQTAGVPTFSRELFKSIDVKASDSYTSTAYQRSSTSWWHLELTSKPTHLS